MMYIFEGVDHSGKDTLIETFRRSMMYNGIRPMPVFDGSNVYDESACPPLVKDPEEFQKAIGWEIVQFIKQTQYDVIINRFTWSEIVYGKVLRNSVSEAWYWGVIEKQLLDVARIIYVYAPEDIIRKRLEQTKRRKSDLVKQKFPELLKAYDELIDKTELDVVLMDSTTYDPDSFDDQDKIFHAIYKGGR